MVVYPSVSDFRRFWPCMSDPQRLTLHYMSLFVGLLPPYGASEVPRAAWAFAYGTFDYEDHWQRFLRAYGIVEEEIEIEGVLIRALRCVGSPAEQVHELFDSPVSPSDSPCDCEVAWWINKPPSGC